MKYFKVKIFPLTFIFILFSIISYRFKSVLFGYIISLIHEAGHILCAVFLKRKIICINILPIGCYAQIDDVNEISVYEQIFIYISGPLMFIPIYFLIQILNYNSILSIYEYNVLNSINYSIAIFNLIPFYPLDGGRIVDAFLSSFLDELNLRKCRILLNFLSILSLFLIIDIKGNLLIFIILIWTFVIQIISFEKDYKEFLIQRLVSKTVRKGKISKKIQIIRNKENYFLNGGKIYNEYYIVQNKLSKLRKRKK